MMTRNTRLTILGLVFLGFIFLLIWLWLSLRTPMQEISIETPDVLEPDVPIDSGPSPVEQQLSEQQQTRVQASGATAVAKIFAERYGSYSNEAQFQNLVDVFPLMTQSFVEQTKEFIQTATLPDTYYGVTTRVVIVHVEQMDEQAGTATILLQTQREIAQGSTQQITVEYQQLRLTLKQEAGVWNVDSANWL